LTTAINLQLYTYNFCRTLSLTMVKFKKVILISERQADKNFLILLAQKLNLELSIYRNSEEMPNILNDFLVFVDSSTEELFLDYEKNTQNFRKIYSHFISNDSIHTQRYIPKSKSFAGFIQRGQNSIEDLVNQYTLAIQSPTIEQLSSKHVSFKTIKFTNTNQKYEAIETVAKELRQEKISERIISIVSNAVDEIVMNSMFDSRTNELGEQVYRFTPRSTAFSLEDKSAVSLKYAVTPNSIILSSSDNFGTFNSEKFYDYIAKIKSNKDFNRAEEGAGIGLAQVFLSGGSIFLYCEPGQKTEVFVVFKKTNTVAEFKSQSKFITSSMAEKEVA
jgi:hypothetical protein